MWAVASDLEQTAQAHGLMLEAAESGDAEAFPRRDHCPL
jgi:hypothetical protein